MEENYAAVRLLINQYMIKKRKRILQPRDHERFIKDVYIEFRENDFTYSPKEILFTWKNLLEKYENFKINFSGDEAAKQWKYFTLMDSCFDNANTTTEKFTNPNLILHLIECLNHHRNSILKSGLTMDVLQAIEDDFHSQGFLSITQKDIYKQWNSFKKSYRDYEKSNYTKYNKNCTYFDAIQHFFGKSDASDANKSYGKRVGAEEPMSNKKVAKTSFPGQTKCKCIEDNKNKSNDLTPFSHLLKDTLLKCIRRKKDSMKLLGGDIDEHMLNSLVEEFQTLGYNITKQAICDEWKDLSCRYYLIKNTENPETWPYFQDLDFIFTSQKYETISSDEDHQVTMDNIDSDRFTNLLSSFTDNDVKITEKLLSICEANSKEFLEIKDILIERNLLREETNFLLNGFIEKLSKREI